MKSAVLFIFEKRLSALCLFLYHLYYDHPHGNTHPYHSLRESSTLSSSCCTNGWHDSNRSPCSTRIRCWEVLKLMFDSVPGAHRAQVGNRTLCSQSGFNLDCLGPFVPHSCQSKQHGEQPILSVSWEAFAAHTHKHKKIKHRASQSIPPVSANTRPFLTGTFLICGGMFFIHTHRLLYSSEYKLSDEVQQV